MRTDHDHSARQPTNEIPVQLTALLLKYEAGLYQGYSFRMESDELSNLSVEEIQRFESTCRQLEFLYSICADRRRSGMPSDVTRAADSASEIEHSRFDVDPGVILGAAGSHLGRFEILRGLGMGGYGIVFLARDPTLDRLVALKIPRPDVLASSTIRRRFIVEGRAAALLLHPNIVTVFESGEAGNICYLVQDYVPGPSLAHWLVGRHEPVPPQSAAQFLVKLAEGVACAHSHDILHRDIKPGNILLAAGQNLSRMTDLNDFVPKLADFGTAKLMRSEGATQTMGVIGTPAYMAPEQAAGLKDEVGPATDIYSLGSILFELMTGQQYRRREQDSSVVSQLNAETAPSPRSVNKIDTTQFIRHLPEMPELQSQ